MRKVAFDRLHRQRCQIGAANGAQTSRTRRTRSSLPNLPQLCACNMEKPAMICEAHDHRVVRFVVLHRYSAEPPVCSRRDAHDARCKCRKLRSGRAIYRTHVCKALAELECRWDCDRCLRYNSRDLRATNMSDVWAAGRRSGPDRRYCRWTPPRARRPADSAVRLIRLCTPARTTWLAPLPLTVVGSFATVELAESSIVGGKIGFKLRSGKRACGKR